MNRGGFVRSVYIALALTAQPEQKPWLRYWWRRRLPAAMGRPHNVQQNEPGVASHGSGPAAGDSIGLALLALVVAVLATVAWGVVVLLVGEW